MVTMVLAPSSQTRSWWETLLNLPPALPSASKTVTFTPFDFSLYAAASPLKQKQKKNTKVRAQSHTHTIKLQKENPETKSPKTNDT